MNTRSNHIIINPEFKDLLSFDKKQDEIEYNAQMISFRILSEVERICDEKKLKKKDLAAMIGTSTSYVTQLFRGTKSINTQVMAKFEDALDITFQIKASSNEAFSEIQVLKESLSNLANKRIPDEHGTWYYCYHRKSAESIANNTGEIVGNLKTEDTKKQIAA